MKVGSIFKILVLVAGTAYSHPDDASGVGATWRQLAAGDAKAAIALIENNHPGASVALRDDAFQARLAIAKQHLASRLPQVTSFGGYAATMAGLAADFQDGHIWSSALVAQRIVEWPGIVPVRRGDAWYVGGQERLEGEPELVGARIISCDGQAFDQFAANRIELFKGDPRVEANLITGAGFLFIDDGNPFLTLPKTCIFERGSDVVSLSFSWRKVLRSHVDDLATTGTHTKPLPRGVQAWDDGYWITLDTLEDEAQTVVDEVREHQAALEIAPEVVIDLRGNGGGDSTYFDKLAGLLVGTERANGARILTGKCGGSYWRASRVSLEAANEGLVKAQNRKDADGIHFWNDLRSGLINAVSTHKAFYPDLPPCAAKAQTTLLTTPQNKMPPSKMTGLLIVVTDHKCFSSCLLAVDLLRRLGALQVGEATNKSTRYMEVKEIALPSGLRTFSTLLKVAVGVGDFGPYSPDHVFPGDISDTTELRIWLKDILASRSQ